MGVQIQEDKQRHSSSGTQLLGTLDPWAQILYYQITFPSLTQETSVISSKKHQCEAAVYVL